MKVFRIKQEGKTPELDAVQGWAGTLGEVKNDVEALPKTQWPELLVEELDVQADKAGVLSILIGEPIITATLRTWGITARGALKEE
jgi:hypothetical protein